MPWSSTTWCDFTEREIAQATQDPGVICVSLGEKGGPDYFTHGESIRAALTRFWASSDDSRQYRDAGRFSFKVMSVEEAQTACVTLRAEAFAPPDEAEAEVEAEAETETEADDAD